MLVSLHLHMLESPRSFMLLSLTSSQLRPPLALNLGIDIRLVMLTCTANPAPPIPHHPPNRRLPSAHMHNLALHRNLLPHRHRPHIFDIQHPTYSSQHPKPGSSNSGESESGAVVVDESVGCAVQVAEGIGVVGRWSEREGDQGGCGRGCGYREEM